MENNKIYKHNSNLNKFYKDYNTIPAFTKINNLKFSELATSRKYTKGLRQLETGCMAAMLDCITLAVCDFIFEGISIDDINSFNRHKDAENFLKEGNHPFFKATGIKAEGLYNDCMKVRTYLLINDAKYSGKYVFFNKDIEVNPSIISPEDYAE